MKIGVSSYSFAKWQAQTGADLFALCDQAKELAFDGIEFTALKSEDPVSEAKKLREKCENIGLPIIAYTVGANLLCDDPDGEAERLMRCVDVAEALGVSLMRHDVATKLREREGYTWQTAAEEMAPRIRAVTEYAAARGIRTCTENHGFLFQDSRRVETLIRLVDHPNYGWLVDLGNFLCADEDLKKAVRRAAPYAVHVHAKDFLYRKKDPRLPDPVGFFKNRNGNFLRGTVVGHGVVPVTEDIRVLRAAGYNGWLSLEFEGMEENIPALSAGLQYLRALAQ